MQSLAFSLLYSKHLKKCLANCKYSMYGYKEPPWNLSHDLLVTQYKKRKTPVEFDIYLRVYLMYKGY